MTDRRGRLARLTPEQRALLERRLAAQSDAALGGPRPGEAGDGPFRPSFSQERFWFLQQLGTRVDEYHMTGLCRLRGPLDRAALERAVALSVERHASLRSRFPAQDGQPSLVIEPTLVVPLVEHAAPSLPADQRDEHIRQRALRLHRRPFDLARGPLVRLELIRFDDRDHGLAVTQHHIVSDGTSFGLLMAEFTASYNAFATGRQPDLPALPLRAVDHAHWQRQRLTGARRDALLAHWRTTLDGAPETLPLPADHARPASPTHAGATLVRRLERPLEQAARELARQRGATLFSVVLAALKAWLARLGDCQDLVVGTSVAQRERPEVAALVGPFVNTVPVRTRLDPDAGFGALVDAVQRASRDALAHAELPFELLVEELSPDRDPAASPIVNVFCDMAARQPPRSWHGLSVSDLSIDTGTASFDLAWMLVETPDGLDTQLSVNTDLFERASLPRLERSLRCLLADALAHPDVPLCELALVDEADRHELLVTLQPPPFVYDRGLPVQRRIEASAARHADHVALVQGGRELTHGALDARAEALARRLVDAGVAPDVPVVVCLPRCLEVLIAVLAIWKAGGVYVPLDPQDPDERLADRLDELRPAVVLARPELAARLADAPGLLLTSDTWPAADPARPPLAIDVAADDLAYVIHTSGSSGRPKGVMISHGALAHHVAWVAERFDLSPDDRLLLRTPLGFDASIWELVHPLVAGATLVVAPDGAQRDPAGLLQLVAEARISVLQTVPSMLTTWLEQPALQRCTALRHLICAGEALVPELVQRLATLRRAHGLGFALHNLYGPSEATIDATVASVDLEAAPRRGSVPIGRPQGNTSVFVLDRRGALLPRGALGELAIGGDGLARGYLQRPELTAARFVDGPAGIGRIYLTGDLGRWGDDGELRYAGRADTQVKLHGQRIELGEVEAVLTTHPELREAVAVLDDDGLGDRRLVAYVVPRAGGQVTPAALRAFLSARLPRALVPSVFVTLDALPLNSNEKVDRRALPPAPRADAVASAPDEAPLVGVRAELAALVGELLGLGPVGAHDDFFALGGHSLLAARLAARVSERFGRSLPLMPFFEAPSVETLARLLEGAGDAPAPGPRPLPRDGDLPASFAQERLWFLAHLDPGSREYHVCGALQLDGALDVPALVSALDSLRARHEALRTTFAERDGQLLQSVAPPTAWPLEQRDLSADLSAGAGAVRDEACLVAAAREALDAPPYDLRAGPLVRGLLLRLAAERHVLVLGLHHAVCDAASLDLLLRELGRAYAAAVAGSAPEQPTAALQPADLAVWQRSQLDGARAHALRSWWRQTLAGAPGSIDLPGETLGPPDDERAAVLLERPLPAALLEGCTALAAERGATLFAVLLAAFDAWLLRLSGQRDLVVATTVDQRDRDALVGLVGLAVNAVPVRVDLSDVPGFGAAVERTSRAVTAALAHAELPFEQLIDALAPARDRRRPPLVNVSFDLLDALPLEQALPGLRARLLPVTETRARLDLSVVVERGPDGARVILECRRSLLSRESLARLWECFEVLLAGLLAEPERALDQVPWLSADEAAAVSAASAGAAWVGPAARDVPTLLALQPGERPALRAADGRRLTHADLARLSARCAAALARAGVGPGQRVAVDLPRSPELVATLLACWRLGAAWMPLDAADPPARRADVLADGRPVLRVVWGADACQAALDDTRTTARSGPRDGDTPSAPAVLDLAVALAAADADADSAPTPTDPKAPAYLLHTSGSTGRPKGVVVPHRALAHVLAAIAADLALAPGDLVLQRLPLSFDAALLELLAPLVAGAEVLLVDDADARDPAAVAALVGRHRATLLQAVPGFLAAVLDEPGLDSSSVRLVGCGGEALPVELLRRLRRRFGDALPVVNMYGPTEATIQAASHHCRADEPGGMPIGRPLPGVLLRVLDAHGGLLPRGVVGELCVGGAGLSDGYLDRPADTAAAFVDDPHGAGRLYRTGDLGRLRGDGLFEWAGRRDSQLKLGGRRVEPAEVEARLAEHRQVHAAAVVPAPGGASLVGHVVAPGLDLTQLRAWLLERLPAALVPARLVAHEALPLGPTGKLDRDALRRAPASSVAASSQPQTVTGTTGDGLADHDELAASLGALCGELLDRPALAPDEDFFQAGGHSLLALRLAEAVGTRLGQSLAVATVFETPTPAGLADALRSGPEQDRAASQAATRAALRADAQLAPGLRPSARRARRPPRVVLLSGATGYLGAHLLARLLTVTDARIHCVVRAADEASARGRVDAALARHTLPPAGARVAVHCGDLASPRLGLDEAIWSARCADTDLVLHCAAAVDFLQPYAGLRAANVESTRALLELACASGAVFQLVSTLGVVALPDWPADEVLDERVALERLLTVEGGYEQSKWVAESLVAEAGRRGLAVGVHRPGRLAGSAAGAAWNADDLSSRLLAGALTLGLRPDVDGAFDLTPVDWVAAAIVQLALDPSADGATTHLFNPTPARLSALFARAAARGLRCRAVPPDAWRAAVAAAVAADPGHPMAALLPLLPADDEQLAPDAGLGALRADHTAALLGADGRTCPAPDARLYDSWLDALRAVAPADAGTDHPAGSGR